METIEILQPEWTGFLNEFNRKHQGWVVTLESVGSEVGDQEEARNLPLVGITADLKGGENRITVLVGGRIDADLNRTIENPRRLWLHHADDERYDALEIEGQDGSKTILKFQVLPVEDTDLQLTREV